MKKLFFLSIFTFLFSTELMMPPPIPSINKTQQKRVKNNNLMPKECSTIPPMLIILPPPLEKDLIKCKNEYFKPSKEFVFKKLKIRPKEIKAVDGFENLYEIKYNKNTIYCNKNLSKCFEVKKWLK